VDDAKTVCEPEVVRQVAKWHVSDLCSYTLVAVNEFDIKPIFVFWYWCFLARVFFFLMIFCLIDMYAITEKVRCISITIHSWNAIYLLWPSFHKGRKVT
jgi:hypothetical protein